MEFVPVTIKIPGSSAFQTIQSRTFLLCGVTLLLTLHTGREVHPQEALSHLPLVTKTDTRAERLYRGILTDIESEDFDRAASGIVKLRTEFSDVLIPVEARHHIAATLLSDILTSRLPDRIALVPLSSKWKSLSGHSLWRERMLGRIAPKELLSTGDHYWRAGEITKAKLFWRFSQREVNNRIRPETSSEVLKRQVVSALFEGRFRQAQTKLNEFKNSFPELTGRVAGEEGNVVEILEQLAETLEESESSAFLGSKSVSHPESGRVDFVRRTWSVDVSRRDTNSRLIPHLWNETVLLQDADGVRALDLKTGDSAWPVDEQDEGFLFETRATPPRREASLASVGGGVIHDNFWYGRTGVSNFTESQRLKSVEQSRVTALNLQAEGRLEWTFAAQSLLTHRNETDVIFSGDPIIAQGRLYVPLRSPAPSNQLQIACLDLTDGTKLWVSDVSASLDATPSDKTSFHDQLVFAEGCLLWSIHGQAVCCVDASNGNLNWISGINSRQNLNQTLSEGHHDLIVSEGRVFATTIDGVAAFDLYTGELRWEQILREPPHSLLGIKDGLLISSSPHLLAMDVQSGRISWQHQVENSRNRRGKLLGHSIIWPRGNELWTVDSQTGRVLQKDFFSNLTKRQAFDLKIQDSILIADEGNQVTIYQIKN